MRNYEAFKDTVKAAASVVSEEKGVPVKLYQWRKRSPFQAARYKDEYVFPEVWVRRGDSGMGAVITGEDVSSLQEARERIAAYLF